MDKVYKRKNLELAWEQVRANRGSGGVDGQNLETFGAQLDQELDRLHTELKQNTYRPQPVRQVPIPKPGKPGEFRTLGIQHAEANGYTVPAEWVFQDEGYSGANLVRPGLEALRDLAAEGEIRAALVYSPDRLSRKYAYQVLLAEELSRCGVELVFLKAPAGTSPEDQLLVQFQGMIAEYERAQIIERSRRGKRHKAHEGLVNVLSGAPYGYRYMRKTDNSAAYYEVVESEAAVVRMVFESYTQQGLSINAIARMLNERQIQAMLEAGSCLEGRLSSTERVRGRVISPVLSNILLTPFDWEMRARGYQLTRYADDWVVTCTSEAEAREAIADAQRILAQLGVQLHPQKTRIVHINRGFEFLGYKIKRGRPRAALRRKLGRSAPAGTVYAYPSEKSINRFKDRVRQLTKRRIPLSDRPSRSLRR